MILLFILHTWEVAVEIHHLLTRLRVCRVILLILLLNDAIVSFSEWWGVWLTIVFVLAAHWLACALEVQCLFLLRWSLVEGFRHLSSFESTELNLAWHWSSGLSRKQIHLMQLKSGLFRTWSHKLPCFVLDGLVHEWILHAIWLLIQLSWVQIDLVKSWYQLIFHVDLLAQF